MTNPPCVGVKPLSKAKRDSVQEDNGGFPLLNLRYTNGMRSILLLYRDDNYSCSGREYCKHRSIFRHSHYPHGVFLFFFLHFFTICYLRVLCTIIEFSKFKCSISYVSRHLLSDISGSSSHSHMISPGSKSISGNC